MSHKYDKIIECFSQAFDEMSKLRLSDVLAKGGVGEIILAHFLNHEIVVNDKGADGVDEFNNKYEYKVSTSDQFNFHFGTRSVKKGKTPSDKVNLHFKDIAGTYCALRIGTTIQKLIYVPSADMVDYLCKHFSNTDGEQLNKNFRFYSLVEIPNSKVLKDEHLTTK